MRGDAAIRRVAEAGAEESGLWLVGGAVRDLLLGDEALDIDLSVEGDAPATAQRMAERLGGTVHASDRFDTATVSAPGLVFDVARARRESYPRPGALPEVAPATIDEDLPRRDFTVNALAASLDPDRLGELRSPPGALEDLESGLLRVMHARSFIDDPTRLLRLARFGGRRFSAEPDTDRLAREALAAGALTTVSGNRIGAELRLLVAKAPPLTALQEAERLGILTALNPALELDEELTASTLALIGEDPERPLAALATVSRGLAPAELRAWLDGLGFPAAERDAIVAAATEAPVLAQSLGAAGRPSEIAAAAARAPAAAIALAGALGAPEPARRWLDELRYVRLEIGGRDLVAAGVPEGPAVGRALAAALAAKLDGTAHGRVEELQAGLAAV
jgi:tRNA nucleotidyltransferase (CCA-adding enzyme)